jgi:hypothetical protein
MQPRFQTYRLAYQLSKVSNLGTEYKMRKVKSKVEICKLSSTTPVFLPRDREALKLPPSPRWSPSQGIPRKGQAPGRVTPWIAPVLPHAQVGLRCAFRQASPGPLPAVFTIKLPAEPPRALFPLVHGGGHTTSTVGVISQDYKPHRCTTRCTQAPLDERYANLTSN